MNARRKRRNDRGFVLIVTLLVLSILVVLAYSFAYAARVNLMAARATRERFARDTAEEAALNYAIALLRTDKTPDVDALDDDWNVREMPVNVAGRSFLVHCVDENRKLNVNLAAVAPADPKATLDLRPALDRVVLRVGGTETDARAIRARIAPDLAGDGDSPAPRRPLLTIESLRAIRNLDEKLLSAEDGGPSLMDLLTTHPVRINVNTAAPAVLEAIWDDADVATRLRNKRERAPFRTTAELETFLTDLLPAETVAKSMPRLGVGSDHFAIEVRPAGLSERLVALVERRGKSVDILIVRRIVEEEDR